jgi:hypothetical protein
VPPKYENPVLASAKKVTEKKKVETAAKSPFEKKKEEQRKAFEEQIGRKTKPDPIDNLRVKPPVKPLGEYTFPEKIQYVGKIAPYVIHGRDMFAHKKEEEDPYRNQYDKKSTTPRNFRNHFRGRTYEEIITGELVLRGLPILGDVASGVPNSVAPPPYDFIDLSNGKQVDMVHFLAVGRRGHLAGTAMEIYQLVRNPKSSFHAQDLYSNRLGSNFFRQYADKLAISPNRIADYIYEFLSNPNNI